MGLCLLKASSAACELYLKDELIVLVQALQIGQHQLQRWLQTVPLGLLLHLFHQQTSKVVLQVAQTVSLVCTLALSLVVSLRASASLSNDLQAINAGF